MLGISHNKSPQPSYGDLFFVCSKNKGPRLFVSGAFALHIQNPVYHSGETAVKTAGKRHTLVNIHHWTCGAVDYVGRSAERA